jgi:hypothetical protein
MEKRIWLIDEDGFYNNCKEENEVNFWLITEVSRKLREFIIYKNINTTDLKTIINDFINMEISMNMVDLQILDAKKPLICW